MNNSLPKILIVEDNRAMCRVISVVLQQAGYDVTCKYDGESGWDATQKCQFDLIITDQQMPKLLGSELCQRLRETPEYQNVPIFMLTAKGIELDQKKLKRDLRIAEIFPKPFSPAAIAQTIDQQLAATAKL